MTDDFMQALFIGQTYIDVTFITDHMPIGDEKHVAKAYAVSFGGNAVTAAFCCAKLGVVPDLIATVANDWLGRMFWDMSAKYGISVHPRKVNASSLSFIMPKDGKRAIVRCRDDEHIHPFPILNIKGCRALHVDGHQPDAAIHYAKLCREVGILTSLDGGGLRSNTHELLEFIDVAIVAERLCEQMDMTSEAMLEYLKSRGCRVGGITMGVVALADRHPKRGETVAGRKISYFPGGKGANQAVAAAKLGAATALIGRVGADAFGRELRTYLAAQGVDLTFVQDTPEAHS